MKIALIIPVYNEGVRFKLLLEEILKFFTRQDIIIIDDGSNDNPVENIPAGMRFLKHDVNCGKGQALRTGFNYAASEGYDWVITMDADGQHPPSCISSFIEKINGNNFQLIAGSRRKNFDGMPFDRRFSNLTTSFIMSVLSGQKILDAQCGFRAYNIDFINKIRLSTSSFDTENEILLNAFQLNVKIGWVDIPAIYSGEKSHIRRLPDTVRFLKLIIKYIFGKQF